MVQVLFSWAGGVLLPDAGGVVALAVVVLAPPGELLLAVVVGGVVLAAAGGVVVLAVVVGGVVLAAAGGAVVLAVACGAVAGAGVAAMVPAVLPEAGGFTQPPPCATVPGGQVCASAMLGAARAAMIASVRSPLLMEQLREG